MGRFFLPHLKYLSNENTDAGINAMKFMKFIKHWVIKTSCE